MTDLLNSLLSTLDEQRRRVLQTLDGLPDEATTGSMVPSGWAPLGVIRHLTIDVEHFWFQGVVAGEALDLPTDDDVWHPTPWPARQLVVNEYQAAAARSDDIIRATPLDALPPTQALSAYPWAPRRSVLATVLHVITETAAHAGHLDIARELIDGRQNLVLTEFTRPDARGLDQS
jgi:hypothetical protein